MPAQFSFTDEFKEKLVLLVMYQNQSVKFIFQLYSTAEFFLNSRKRLDYSKN